MVRSLRGRVALLGVLALLGGAFLIPDLSAPVEPAFRSFDEARAFLLARCSQDPDWKLPDDAYSGGYLREYQKRDGSRTQIRLVNDPARELALAEGFRATGFHKQALYHYEVILRHHSRSPQARNARARIGACRSDTVLGLVAGAPLIQGPGKQFFAPARRPLETSLDELLQRKDLTALAVAFRKPLLPAGTLPAGPLVRVGRYSAVGDLKRETAPVPVSIEDLPRGAWYEITQPESLFASETLFKLACLTRLRDLVPSSQAFIDEQLALLGEHRAARAQAKAPAPEALKLDALWTEAVEHNARFTLQTTNALTTTATLPVTIEAGNIDSIRFHVERVEGAPPAQLAELNAWAFKAPAASVAVHEFPLKPGTQTVECPLPAPGIHRVTASSKGLSCRFLAVRSNLQAQALVSPNNSALLFDRGGLTLSRGAGPLVKSDDRGLALLQGAGRSAICEEHRSCCATCASCDHHHGGQGGPHFVSGPNHAALLGFADLPSVPPVPAVPLLFLGTDRPVYKAGDTLRFRGIARIPKPQLDGSEPSRHDPASGQTARVVASQNKAAFFEREYSTNEAGTFHGEIPLPLSAARTTCELTVSYLGRSETLPFEIRDYKKTDFAVLLSPGADGVRYSAGYVWGLPVPGARVEILVDGRPATPVDGRIEAKDGQRVQVQLRRDDELLASQALTYHAPAPSTRAEAAVLPAAPPQAPGAPPPTTTVRELRLHNRSVKDAIVLELEAPADLAEALLVLGDVQIYEVARIPLRQGRGRASFPVRPIYDPQVAAFAFAGDLEARTDVALRNRQLPVKLELPAKARPGDTVELKVHSQPGAYFSVAAVDEAIFALKADETPALYQHFHPVRAATLKRALRPLLSLPGEQHSCEQDPPGDFFRAGNDFNEVADDAEFALVKGLNDVIGGGGGGSGSFGGRMGGSRRMVVRAGGMASESAVDRALLAFARLQRPDGLWDGSALTAAGTLDRRGNSALVLLGFVGAGYSHLSKDTHGGFVYGDVVRKGLAALMQAPAPQPGDSTLNESLVQLAISEAFGLTGSQFYRPAAETGLAELLRRQSPDGGWHRSDPTQRGEASATTFAVMAIKSAQLGGLEIPAAPAARALSFVLSSLSGAKSRAELGGLLLSAHFLRKDDEDSFRKEAVAKLVALGHGWNEGDALGAYLGSLALFQHDGPTGPQFSSWRDSLRAACTAAPGGDAPPAAAFRVLSQEVYYRYANVFGSSKLPDDERPLAPLPRIRIHFPDTALWEPELVTDARGEARIKIPLGDELTTTRVTARGITRDGAAGEALAQVTTEQPFFIKLKSPEFAVTGDEIEVRAELHHTEQAPRTARVTLEGHGTREAELRPGEAAAVSWRVPVRESGQLVLRARASAGAQEDAVERRLPVLEPGRESRAVQRKLLNAGKEFSVTSPEGARELTVRLHPRRAPLTRVLDALRYLTEYPYG